MPPKRDETPVARGLGEAGKDSNDTAKHSSTSPTSETLPYNTAYLPERGGESVIDAAKTVLQ